MLAADQVYGDQEMHSVVRNHCMDYMVSIPSNTPSVSMSYSAGVGCMTNGRDITFQLVIATELDLLNSNRCVSFMVTLCR